MQRAGRPDLPAGRATSSREKRVVTEQRRAYRWSGGLSRSSWWLVAKNDGGPVGVLTLDEGDTLPVFSGEGEAELFLWLRGEDQRGWGVHQSSAEELVFVLSGPLSHAGLVVLDPSAEIFDGRDAELPGLGREEFLEWIVSKDL